MTRASNPALWDRLAFRYRLIVLLSRHFKGLFTRGWKCVRTLLSPHRGFLISTFHPRLTPVGFILALFRG